MFDSLFASRGPALIPMQRRHAGRVLEIIAQTDEDDAAEAENAFASNGTGNMFVLQEDGNVLGIIGYAPDEQMPDLAWLSWTYLDAAHTGKGLGAMMLNDLLGTLAKQNIRKIFIETSDYEEAGERIYAGAHRLYEEFGAGVELTVPDYHAPGEAKIIYGLDNPEAFQMPTLHRQTSSGLAIDAVQLAPETKDVADLRWTETESGLDGLDWHLFDARNHKFRMAVLAVPSDLSDANAAALEENGLRQCGRLNNYYGTDLHQTWWTCNLDENS